MKYIITISIAIITALMAWRIGGVLSSDAVAMALGLVFGLLGGLPIALLVVAASNRQSIERERPTRRDYMLAEYARMDAERERSYPVKWRVVDHVR